MLQVRGNRKRFDGFVGKLLGKKMIEPLTEFFTRQLPGPALEFAPYKFQPVRFGPPKALHGQD